MLELELTYLLKYLPANLTKSPSKEYSDIYLPYEAIHPVLRVRKRGNIYEITKKTPVSDYDSSIQNEFTIKLSSDEYNSIADTIQGKKVRKIRYFYEFNGILAEIDVFMDDLLGLIEADFEFENEKDKINFKMPDFCLVEVTQAEFLAGGMLCGKKYHEIAKELNKFKYKPLYLKENK